MGADVINSISDLILVSMFLNVDQKLKQGRDVGTEAAHVGLATFVPLT